jgi:hypothetical protein
MARHALLIGVSDFADERLARLNAPVNDVTALHGILQDGTRGNFATVELSLNEDFLAIRDRLSRFFHDRAPDDLLLLYYSGHGILGRGNRLFLASNGSNLDTPRSRSISAQEIRDLIEESRAQRQIVVLDCCHSGAFAEHAKTGAAAPAVTAETFSASDAGLYVLTAADALQFAWDGAELRSGDQAVNGFSRFTSWLVDGLEKGEAAPDDEQITMDGLYRYLIRRARSEGSAATPQRFVQGGVGDLVISANPLAGSSQIDPAVLSALEADEFRMRLGAVAELALPIEEGNAPQSRAARLLLQRHLQRERDYQVRRAIVRALASPEEPQRAEAERKTEEDSLRAGSIRPRAQDKQEARVAPHQQRISPTELSTPTMRSATRIIPGHSLGRWLKIAAVAVFVAVFAAGVIYSAHLAQQRADAAKIATADAARAAAARAAAEKQQADAARAAAEKQQADVARAAAEKQQADVARAAAEKQQPDVAEKIAARQVSGKLASVTDGSIAINDHGQIWRFSVDAATTVFVDAARRDGVDAIRHLQDRAVIVYFTGNTVSALRALKVYVTSIK